MINPIPILLAVSLPCLAIPKDKQLHLVAGSAISSVAYGIAKQAGSKHPDLWAIGAALAIGLAKELHDRKQPGNRFDPADCGATVAGGIVVTYAIRW